MARPDNKRIYNVILADPPWPGQSGEKHYPTMTIERIRGLGDAIRSVTAPDSWCFLWTTRALVDEAKTVLASWSYEYRDQIWWGKLNRFGRGNPAVGIRRASEILLIGSRGNVRAKTRNTPDYFIAPVSTHSTKPGHDAVIVDALAGSDSSRLELFARRHRVGFHVWGDDPSITPDLSFKEFGYPVPADEPAASQEAA